MSVADAFRNFLSSLSPEQKPQLNLRSCEACSFHKLLNRTHFCTQVQPASTINNVYDAQLCIYYTPETATTGQITITERETQKSQIDLVKRINIIDLISAITKIDEITEIGNIDNAVIRVNPIRNPTFSQNFKDWIRDSTTKITAVADATFGTAVYFNSARDNMAYLYQYIAVDSDKFPIIAFAAKKPAAGVNIRVAILYTDGSTDEEIITLTTSWAIYTKSASGSKIIKCVRFQDDYGVCYLAIPQLVESSSVIITDSVQSTQALAIDAYGKIGISSLGRENLLVESKTSWVFASGTSQEIIAATANQKIKVYAVDYLNNNADVRTEFDFTIGGASKYWGTRATKGLFAQTLVNPIVCDVNTALKFKTGGAVTLEAVHVQYVKE